MLFTTDYKPVPLQLLKFKFSRVIKIICLDILWETLRAGTQPRQRNVNVWTYLLIVFELDIKPAGLDHPSVLCSWLTQCAEGKSTSPPELDVERAVWWHGFCDFILLVSVLVPSLSASDFQPRSLLPFLSLPLRGVLWCAVCVCVCVCRECVCGVTGLEVWQKSSSDGLQMCSAVVADASRGECFPSERVNSRDWSLPNRPLLLSFFYLSFLPCMLPSSPSLASFLMFPFSGPLLTQCLPPVLSLLSFMHR